MAVTRRVVVDDTSPLIQYEDSSWFLDSTGALDAKGNFGPAYNKTLHATITSTSFSFAYTGSGVRVLGSNNVHNDSVGIQDPQWECFVDGIRLPRLNPFPYFENSWIFCDTTSTPLDTNDDSHILTVNVTVQQAQAFYLDRLLYIPSPDASFLDETIIVENTDPELQFGSGWGEWGVVANFTGQTGSKLTFHFHGISLSWYGFIPHEIPHAAATGTFSVDDETPRTFTLKGLPDDEKTTYYNQEFFRTPDYPRGRHKLDVVFLGNDQTTSLILDYLIIWNTSVSLASPTNSSTPTLGSGGPINPNAGAASGSRNRLGAIVGGVLGGLASLLLAVLLGFYLHRRRRIRKTDGSTPQNVPIIPTGREGLENAGSVVQSYYPASPSSPLSGLSYENAPQFLPSSKIIRRQHNSVTSGSYNPSSPTAPGYGLSPQNSPGGNAPATSSQPRSTEREPAAEPNVIMHEDSGIRNVLVTQPLSVEIPPTYTPT